MSDIVQETGKPRLHYQPIYLLTELFIRPPVPLFEDTAIPRGIKQPLDELPGKVHDAEGVPKPRMLSPMVDEGSQAELTDSSQPLELESVDDIPFPPVHVNISVYGIPESAFLFG